MTTLHSEKTEGDRNMLQEALRLLGIYTAGTYDIWQLAGSHKASVRAHIMSVLIGKKMPQSKSGITALRQEFYARLGIGGGCLAEQKAHFLRVARLGAIKIVSLKPKGKYADGSPIYEFSTSYPTSGIRPLKGAFDSPEGAAEDGKKFVSDYERKLWPGGMGQLIGVTEVEGGYFAVVNTYYSPS